MTREFRSIVVKDEFGAVNDDGFTLFDDPRDMLLAGGGLEFHICAIGSRHIAGFIAQPVPPERRATLAATRPAWLDVLLSIEVADVDARPAVIDTHILGPGDADPAECAVASALIAVETGEVEFDATPSDYLVRLGPGHAMRVTLHDDEQSKVWHGRARADDAGARALA